jgi:Bacterial Ig-like domain (group 3)/RHS Repeat
MKASRLFTFAASCICAGGITHAGQTITYRYDALGRLVQVQAQAGSGSGVIQNFQFDGAGNRKGYQTLIQVVLSMTPVANLTSAGTTLTVDISNPSATGTVTFTESGTLLGTTSVSDGQATVILEGLSKGTHTIVASYSGDGSDATQTATFTVKVQDLGWLPAVLQLLLN